MLLALRICETSACEQGKYFNLKRYKEVTLCYWRGIQAAQASRGVAYGCSALTVCSPLCSDYHY